MSLNTYLMFNGTCREAFEFYRSVFGGEFAALMTYADAPADMTVPADEKDRVMHVSLPIGDSVLMGSDTCSTSDGPVTVGNNFSISIIGQSRAHCDEMFAKLSAGGTVRMPMSDTFWDAYFGMWTDKFDINWMVNYELPKG